MQTPDQYKIVRDAVAARERAEQALADATADLQRQRDELTAWERGAAEAQLAHQKPTGRKRRMEGITEAESNVRVAQEAVRLAHEREKEARAEARSRTLRAVSTAYTKAIRELDEALDHAASVNARVQRLYREGRDALGSKAGLEPLHWQELDLYTPHDSKIKAWRRNVNSKLRTDEPHDTSESITDEEANTDAAQRLSA